MSTQGTGWGLTPFSVIRQSLPDDRFVQIDGQQVYFEEAGSGEPLLLLHGFAASSYSFREIIPRLAASHRVVAVDLNGFGFTERPRQLEAYSPSGQVALLIRLMDVLGMRECCVAGHSYGGMLGLLLAIRHPERIRRLALISPPSIGSKLPWFLRTRAGRLVGYGMVRGLLARPKSFRKAISGAYHRSEILTEEVSEEYRRRLRIEGLFGALRGFSVALEGGSFEIDFAEFRRPVLVLAGAHDRIVDGASAREWAEKLPRSRADILENSGHSSPEEEPEKVASLLQSFFRLS